MITKTQILSSVLVLIVAAAVYYAALELISSSLGSTGKLFATVLVGVSFGFVGSVIDDLWGREFASKLGSLEQKLHSIRKPRVSGPRQSFSIKFVSNNKRLKDIASRIGVGLQKDVIMSGLSLSPYALASRYLFYSVVAVIISIPVSILLAYLVSPVFLALIALPAVMMAVPKFKLSSARGERNRSLEDELPFFTMYASIMQMVGLSLYNSFINIIGRGIFRYVEKDALLLQRNEMFFDRDPVSALEGIGRKHPSEKMKSLILGYTSQLRSGGDVSNYLASKADDFLKDMKFRWQSYANSTANIGEMMVSLFFILPVLVIVSAFVSPSSINLVDLLTVVLIPFFSVLALQIISSMQPKTYNVIEVGWKMPVIVGMMAALATIPFREAWLSVASGMMGATSLYGFIVVTQLKEISQVEKALPQFVRDVTEYKKMGYDIQKALLKIADGNTYNPVFDSILSAMARQIRMGLSLGSARLHQLKSWLGKLTLFLLSEIADSGGGSPASLEILGNFVTDVYRVRKETKSQMRMYEILAYITPVGLSFAISIMVVMMSAFASSSVGSGVSFLSGLGTAGPSLEPIANLLVVISSVGIAMIAGKSVDYTSKSVIRIAVNLAIAVVAISIAGSVAHNLLSGVVGSLGAP
ncbi:MAG: type II secretion system F family protein [Nitrososphaerota archaeon]|nr:type II secretion system F family protein [Nitrososphaerota archaeon]